MDPVANFCVPTEKALQFIIKHISLDSEHRKLVCTIVMELVNSLTIRLKQQLNIFISVHYLLCGSYRDRIKISQIDEFDFNIVLGLPGAIFKADQLFPGLLRIDVSECIKFGEYGCVLRSMTDSDGYLKVRAFQGWFESFIAKTRINEQLITICDHSLSIKITKSGPAHKLSVTIKDCPPESSLENFKFSIDLVPGLKCNIHTYSPDSMDECIAIPKPINGAGNNDHTYFVPSFPCKEYHILKEKNNLKNCLRLLKKLRDRHNINNLKSYFIKTMFLWMNKYTNNKYWDQPCEDILLKAMETMRLYLEKRNLPFYWHPKYNMLSKLSSTQIDSMRMQIESIIKKFKKSRNTLQLVKLFLTPVEQQQHAQRWFKLVEGNIKQLKRMKTVNMSYRNVSKNRFSNFLSIGKD